MNTHQQRLFICGIDEFQDYKARKITHLITVANPGAPSSKSQWMSGKVLELWFGDVVSEKDARQCQTTAPTVEDIQKALDFFRAAWRSPETRVLVSCDYGASRSPALSYVILADQLGAGQEASALETILRIRPNAVPNKLVVQLGDALLKRHGALLQPLQCLYAKINEEISKSMGGER